MVLFAKVTTWFITGRKLGYNFKMFWRFHIVESKLLLTTKMLWRFHIVESKLLLTTKRITTLSTILMMVGLGLWTIWKFFWAISWPVVRAWSRTRSGWNTLMLCYSYVYRNSRSYRFPTVSGITLRACKFVNKTAARYMRFYVLELEKS